jgi:hypothetical protein
LVGDRGEEPALIRLNMCKPLTNALDLAHSTTAIIAGTLCAA